jgi:polysaccharide export outer membrane protein
MMSLGFKTMAAALALVIAATMAMSQSSYRLKDGDVVNLEVLEDASLNRSLVVLPDGTINVPFAGTIRAAGQTVSQVQAAITSGISPQFATRPNVFVSVNPKPDDPLPPPAPVQPEEEETIKIYFMGEVNEPGLREVSPGTTFLQGVSTSGGLTRFAATKRLQLRRTSGGRPTLITINYHALSRGAQLEQDIILHEGDVILVPERRLFE